MADEKSHFCTCGDLACPHNPNNPKNAGTPGFGCDACIRKNLACGEVPSCIFKNVGDTEGWNDWSVEGFVRFVSLNRKTDA